MPVIVLIAVIGGPQALVIAALGDASVAALIAGIFLIINTVVTIFATYVLAQRRDDRPPPKKKNGQVPNRALRRHRNYRDRGDNDSGNTR